jgi:hypothetical protein
LAQIMSNLRAALAVTLIGAALAGCADPPQTVTTTTSETTTSQGQVPPPPALTPGTPGTVTTQTTNAQSNP